MEHEYQRKSEVETISHEWKTNFNNGVNKRQICMNDKWKDQRRKWRRRRKRKVERKANLCGINQAFGILVIWKNKCTYENKNVVGRKEKRLAGMGKRIEESLKFRRVWVDAEQNPDEGTRFLSVVVHGKVISQWWSKARLSCVESSSAETKDSRIKEKRNDF